MMTTPTLGQCLAQTLASEQQGIFDLEGALAQRTTDESRASFLAAKQFFDEARQFFTHGIQAKHPTATLFLQVGGRGFVKADNYHDEFVGALDGGYARNSQEGPDSLHDPQQLAPLWLTFRKWAEDNGLCVRWTCGFDHNGHPAWWQLRVAPAPN